MKERRLNPMIKIRQKDKGTIESMRFYEMLIGDCFDYADSTEAPLIAMKISDEEAFVFETSEVMTIYDGAYLPIVDLDIEWKYRKMGGGN